MNRHVPIGYDWNTTRLAQFISNYEAGRTASLASSMSLAEQVARQVGGMKSG